MSLPSPQRLLALMFAAVLASVSLPHASANPPTPDMPSVAPADALAQTFHSAFVPECLSDNGQTACGYNCVAAYGQVRCARWPGGVCQAANGSIECGPPPAHTGFWWNPYYFFEGTAQAECMSAFGQTECGYNCEAAFGQVACADHPLGECLADFGQIECGFGCVSGYGQVRCSRRPDGVCAVENGSITCF